MRTSRGCTTLRAGKGDIVMGVGILRHWKRTDSYPSRDLRPPRRSDAVLLESTSSGRPQNTVAEPDYPLDRALHSEVSAWIRRLPGLSLHPRRSVACPWATRGQLRQYLYQVQRRTEFRSTCWSTRSAGSTAAHLRSAASGEHVGVHRHHARALTGPSCARPSPAIWRRCAAGWRPRGWRLLERPPEAEPGAWPDVAAAPDA